MRQTGVTPFQKESPPNDTLHPIRKPGFSALLCICRNTTENLGFLCQSYRPNKTNAFTRLFVILAASHGGWGLSYHFAGKTWCAGLSFGGGGSIELNAPFNAIEVYNDLNGDAVNLFKIVANPQKLSQLLDLIFATPYSRAEFHRAFAVTHDPLEQARRFLIRQQQSFGGLGRSFGVKSTAKAAIPRI